MGGMAQQLLCHVQRVRTSVCHQVSMMGHRRSPTTWAANPYFATAHPD